jgi:WD40 repeat protein
MASSDSRFWDQVREAFGEALDVEPARREAWLDGHLADEPALLAEVRSLLARSDESMPAAPGAPAAQGPGAGHPTRLGPYRILSLLGEGGMGAVYEAEQLNPHRRVALKIIRAALASDETRRRFELEGEVLGHLRHPAIAQVYETGAAELGAGVEVPYLAMEHVGDARTLMDHVRANLSGLEQRLELFCQIVDGVEHAHQRGIVHRDLKPANVLVDAEGHPKLIDFGLARAVDEETDLLSMHTRTGQIMGTPTYMSPEQFAGRPDEIEITSDVYSLGVILFELVTGELPHRLDGMSVVEMARVVREQPARSLSQTATRMRDDLDTIVAKALDKQPDRRYESAAALAADVRRYLRHEPVHARPASALYQARLFARRNRALVVSAVLVLLMAIAATAISISYALDASRRADEAERSSYRTRLLAAVGELEDLNVRAATELLDGAPERLRGWEHRHLVAQLDPGLPVPEALPPSIGALARADRSHEVLVGIPEPAGMALEVWDPRTWKRRLAVPPAAYRVFTAQLSPSGSFLARLNLDPVTLEVWEVATGEQLVAVPMPELDPPALGLSWQTDERVLETTSAFRREIRDARTGALLAAESHAEDLVHHATRNGRWRLEASRQTTSLLDREQEDAVVDELHSDSPSDLSYILAAPRGARVAVARHDGSLQMLDVEDGRLVVPWTGGVASGFVNAMGWAPRGRKLATGTSLGLVHIWDGATGQLVRQFQLEGALEGIAFVDDGKELLVCTGEGRRWRLPAGPPNDVFTHETFVYPVVLDETGGMVLSGSWDGNADKPGALRLWDLATGAEVAAYGDPGDVIYSAALSPDGRHAVLGVLRGGWDASTRVLDLVTGEASRRGPFMRSKPSRVSVHPDGRRVLSSFGSGLVVVWDLVTGEEFWSAPQGDAAGDALLRQAGQGQSSSAISPDGGRFAFAHEGTDIRLIDAETYEDLATWPAHEALIWSLTYSPDGRWLLSTSVDGTVGVWDAESGALVARLVGHGTEVFCAAVSPDGTRIATGGRDRLLRLWETTRFDNVANLPGHEAYLYSVVWSADGERLVTGGGDGQVRVWETQGEGLRALAARERRELVPSLETRVAQALPDADEPATARAALLADDHLSSRERQIALQLATEFAFQRAGAQRAGRPDAEVDPQYGGPLPADSVHVDQPWGSFEMALHLEVGTTPPVAPAFYRAPRTDSPVVIDGRMDEADWQQAPWTGPFVDIEGAAKPTPQHTTRVRMLWDDEHLYVAAWLDEPHVWGTLTEHDSIIYRDNDFEVFLDPDGDGLAYAEIEVNALGTIFDLMLDKPYNQGGRPHIDWSPPGVAAAVSIAGTLNGPGDEDQGWGVEIAIPHQALAELSDAPLPPRPGDVWRVNFSRVQWQHDVVDGRYVKRPATREDNWVWTPQFAINMHLPRQWGFVQLAP